MAKKKKSFSKLYQLSIRQSRPKDDEDWNYFYLDYKSLKACLFSFYKRRISAGKMLRRKGAIYDADLNSLNVGSSSLNYYGGEFDYLEFCEMDMFMEASDEPVPYEEVFRRISFTEKREFKALLDFQVHKVVTFYRTKLEELKKSCDLLHGGLKRRNLDTIKRNSCLEGEKEKKDGIFNMILMNILCHNPDLENDIVEGVKVNGELNISENSCKEFYIMKEEIRVAYEYLGSELLELYAFLITNLLGLRQVLIRYDAYAQTVFGRLMSNWYLKSKENKSNDDVKQLLNIEEIQRLIVSFVEIVRCLEVEHLKHQQLKSDKLNEVVHPSTYLKRFVDQIFYFDKIIIKMDEFVTTPPSKSFAAMLRKQNRNGVIVALRKYLLLGSIAESLELEPSSMLMLSGTTYEDEIKMISDWRMKKNKNKYTIKDLEGTPGTIKILQNMFVEGFIFNLFSTWLYTVNNCILQPSVAYYIESLGVNQAYSSIVIGIGPFLSIFSMFLYSYWTNYGYKYPIMFSSVFLIFGNIVYSEASRKNSLSVLILGRMLTGFGAPILMNRRYLADTTPNKSRNAASALFTISTVLGNCCGPVIAILLNQLNTSLHLQNYGAIYFNGMTNPGYFMAFMWFIYFLLVLFLFHEIEEQDKPQQQQRPQQQSIPRNIETSSPTSNFSHFDNGSKSILESLQDDDLEEKNCFVDEDNQSQLSNHSYCSIKSFLKPEMKPQVCLCLILVFIKMFTQESFMISIPIIGKNKYYWSIMNIGTLHFLINVMIIPISIIVGWITLFYEERKLLLSILLISIISVVFLLIDYTDLNGLSSNSSNNFNDWLSVGPMQYIFGNIIVQSCLQGSESIITSILSKLVPMQTTGIWNYGLSTTLIATVSYI